jgi:hypothetical protein
MLTFEIGSIRVIANLIRSCCTLPCVSWRWWQIASVKSEQEILRQQVQDMEQERRVGGGRLSNRNFNIEVGDHRGEFVTPSMLKDRMEQSQKELLPHMESMLAEQTIPKWRLNGQFNKVQDEIASLKQQLSEMRKPKEKLRQWNNEQQWFDEVRESSPDSPGARSSSTLSKANLDAHESRSRRNSASAVLRANTTKSKSSMQPLTRRSSMGSIRQPSSPSRLRLSRRGSDHSVSGISLVSLNSELEELKLQGEKLEAQKEMNKRRLEEIRQEGSSSRQASNSGDISSDRRERTRQRLLGAATDLGQATSDVVGVVGSSEF